MDKSKWIYFTFFFIFILGVVFFRNLSFNKEESFKILPFDVADSIDSIIYSGGFPPPSRRDFFLVSGFESYEKNLIQVDSFVCSKSLEIDSILKKDSRYAILFFKQSEITNNVHLKAHPGDYEEYSLFFDLICRYDWGEHSFWGRRDPKHKYAVDTLMCFKQ